MGLWDRERLERMVFNLLSNACKFGKGGAIEVRLRAGRESDDMAQNAYIRRTLDENR